MNVRELRHRFEQARGRQDLTQRQLKETTLKLNEFQREQLEYEQAIVLFQDVCQKTQAQVQEHLADIVSISMNAIFNHPYELNAEFVQRRGKTECDLMFLRDGEKLDPLASSGYGAVDVASFALRVALWFINGKQSAPVLILDEPFKHLKGLRENQRVLSMMRDIAKTFGLQIIMVSDERIPREEIIEGADKVFEVSKTKGRSVVNET